MRKIVITGAALCALAVLPVPLRRVAVTAHKPGYPIAIGNTICAGHGAFGAFSGDPGAVHDLVLADKAAGISLGSETGPANSNLCGNPQG